MITEKFNKEKLTFNELPMAISYLIDQVEQLKQQIAILTPSRDTRTTINIDEAVELIQKAKPTIYTLVRLGKIPAYKKGKKLYFIKEELQAWLHETPTRIIEKPTAIVKRYGVGGGIKSYEGK